VDRPILSSSGFSSSRWLFVIIFLPTMTPNDWKSHAKHFLSASFTKPLLHDLYKKITGNNREIKKDEMIDAILSKIKSPLDLLKKQEITVSIIRSLHSVFLSFLIGSGII
jgi:hypothetical protein